MQFGHVICSISFTLRNDVVAAAAAAAVVVVVAAAAAAGDRLDVASLPTRPGWAFEGDSDEYIRRAQAWLAHVQLSIWRVMRGHVWLSSACVSSQAVTAARLVLLVWLALPRGLSLAGSLGCVAPRGPLGVLCRFGGTSSAGNSEMTY